VWQLETLDMRDTSELLILLDLETRVRTISRKIAEAIPRRAGGSLATGKTIAEAVSIRSDGTSISFTVSAARSSCGSPQWPSSMASASA